MERQSWRISVKGYNPQMFKDSLSGNRPDGKSYQDTTYGYGYVFFYGTESEVGDEEMRLFRAGCKILGSELWQPNSAEMEMKRKVKALSDKAYKKFIDLCDHNDEKHPEIGWFGRIQNGSRNYTNTELKLKAVADRIWAYYIKKYVSPYL